MSSRFDKSQTQLAEQRTKILKALMAKPENKKCADCRKKDPRWASWNLGIFVCIQCSGIHRSIGTHITKVKSADLDIWTEDQIIQMTKWGNAKANLYWEHEWPKEMVPSERSMDQFIRAKYERKQYAMKGGIPDPDTLGATTSDNLITVSKPTVPLQNPTTQMFTAFAAPTAVVTSPPVFASAKSPSQQLFDAFATPAPTQKDMKESILSLYGNGSAGSPGGTLTNNLTNNLTNLNNVASGLQYTPYPPSQTFTQSYSPTQPFTQAFSPPVSQPYTQPFVQPTSPKPTGSVFDVFEGLSIQPTQKSGFGDDFGDFEGAGEVKSVFPVKVDVVPMQDPFESVFKPTVATFQPPVFQPPPFQTDVFKATTITPPVQSTDLFQSSFAQPTFQPSFQNPSFQTSTFQGSSFQTVVDPIQTSFSMGRSEEVKVGTPNHPSFDNLPPPEDNGWGSFQ